MNPLKKLTILVWCKKRVHVTDGISVTLTILFKRRGNLKIEKTLIISPVYCTGLHHLKSANLQTLYPK